MTVMVNWPGMQMILGLGFIVEQALSLDNSLLSGFERRIRALNQVIIDGDIMVAGVKPGDASNLAVDDNFNPIQSQPQCYA